MCISFCLIYCCTKRSLTPVCNPLQFRVAKWGYESETKERYIQSWCKYPGLKIDNNRGLKMAKPRVGPDESNYGPK